MRHRRSRNKFSPKSRSFIDFFIPPKNRTIAEYVGIASPGFFLVCMYVSGLQEQGVTREFSKNCLIGPSKFWTYHSKFLLLLHFNVQFCQILWKKITVWTCVCIYLWMYVCKYLCMLAFIQEWGLQSIKMPWPYYILW